MIGYALYGTNDYERAVQFYDELLGSIGAQRGMGTDRITTWTTGQGPLLGVCSPANGEPATNGNGTMLAIALPDRAAVDKLLDKAKEIGAPEVIPAHEDESNGFYGGYARDLDNNKFCFFNM